MQGKLELQFINLAGKFLSFIEFTGLSFGALCFQLVETLQIGGGDLIGFSGRNQVIPRIALSDLDNISLGTQTGDIFLQNYFSVRHKDSVGKSRNAITTSRERACQDSVLHSGQEGSESIFPAIC